MLVTEPQHLPELENSSFEIRREERSECKVADSQNDPQLLSAPLAEHQRFVEVRGRALIAALHQGQVAGVVVKPSKSVNVPYVAIQRRGLGDLGVDISDLEREHPKCERVGDEPLVAGLAGIRERFLRKRSRAAGVVQRETVKV